MGLDNYVEREELFYQHWLDEVNKYDQLDRSKLQLLISKEQEYPVAVGGIIKDLCRLGNLSIDDSIWIVSLLPEKSFSTEQIRAYMAINDHRLTWLQKLNAAIDNKATWAAFQMINSMSEKDLEEAGEAIKRSHHSRSLRLALVEVSKSKFGIKPRNWK